MRRLLLDAIHERGMTEVTDVTIRVLVHVPPMFPNWEVPHFEAPAENLAEAEAIVWEACRVLQGKFDVSTAA